MSLRADAAPVDRGSRRSRTPSRTCIAAALVAVAGLAASTAHAACQVESYELPVKMVGSRAIATVGINGTQVPLLVDSGADYSFLTQAVAEELRLSVHRLANVRVMGVAGEVDTQAAIVDRLTLLGGDIAGIEFAVGGNEPGSGAKGILGRNILSVFDTEYDLTHGVVRLMKPNDDCAKASLAYWAGSAPVSEVDLIVKSNARNPAIRARIKLNDASAVALFDSGAASTTITHRAASRAGVAEADLKPSGFVRGMGSGTRRAWMAPFERIEIGGEAIIHNTMNVSDITLGDSDLLIGIDFFLSHRIYVSKSQQKMYFTYNGGPVFALGRGEPTRRTTDETAGDDGPTTAAAFATRGAASASRRDFASALKDLDRACALEPETAAWFAQRGPIHEALKNPSNAMQDYDRALALDPTLTDARLHRASLRLAAKDRDGARADLATLDGALAPQANPRWAMATLFLALDEPAPAIAQLDRWLAAHPNEVGREAALAARCRARVRLDIELERALDDCDGAVSASSKNPAFVAGRGWVHLRMGNAQRALSDFERAAELRPGDAAALYGRGLARRRTGDDAGADADLAAARKAQADIDTRLARAGLLAGSLASLAPADAATAKP